MSLEVLPFREEFRGGFNHVRSIVYRDGESVPNTDNLVEDDLSASVALVNGEVAAACVARSMECTWFGETLPCAGVAAVGVLPEHRGMGVGTAFMKGVLRQYYNEEFEIAALYAYRPPFYRKAGYELCGSRVKITCPFGLLPKPRSDRPMRLIKMGDFESIKPCYEAFARAYNGQNIRSDRNWWRQMGGDKPFHIYAYGEPIQGYVAVRLDMSFWVPMSIYEIAWSTGEGYEACQSMIASLGINKSEVSWCEPWPSPYFSRSMDQTVKIEIERPAMYRIINLRSALERLRCDSPTRLTLEIEDADISENNGCWSVVAGPEHAEVTRVSNGEIKATIGHLTQAFLGDPNFESLARCGAIHVDSEDAYQRAAWLFPPASVHCSDFF
ncbi:MAG: GNAT family N-acetyltransferase [Fimbriimonadaceae bacterium]|nr:GNAT family N-acetyltransferase [Fimbriimonadaceae bacterium]